MNIEHLKHVVKNLVTEVRSSSLVDSIDLTVLSDMQLKRLSKKLDAEFKVRKQQNKISGTDKRLVPVDVKFIEEILSNIAQLTVPVSIKKRFQGGFFVDSVHPNSVYAKTVKGVLYRFDRLLRSWVKVQ